MQTNDHPQWGDLSRAVKAARMSAGYPKRAPFARFVKVDDSTVAVIEGDRPGRVSEDMLDYVTVRLGWAPGFWRTYLGETSQSATNEVLEAFSEEDLLTELLRRAGQRRLAVGS